MSDFRFEWTPEDSSIANREGWIIGEHEGRLHLLTGRRQSRSQLIELIRQKAEEGSETHQRAQMLMGQHRLIYGDDPPFICGGTP